MTPVQNLIAERERQFIETRLLICQWVEKLMENVSQIDPKLLTNLDVPKGKTAQELLPSLFVTPFDFEQYEKEAAVLNAFQSRLDALADWLNAEALKCLSE